MRYRTVNMGGINADMGDELMSLHATLRQRCEEHRQEARRVQQRLLREKGDLN